MSDTNLLRHAIEIAVEVHSGQLDKNGQPYIGHVLRVMNAGNSTAEKIVGALHDVIEDSNLTLEDLKNEGFPEEILNAVDAMTHTSSESYEEYLQRLIKNPIAVRVKLNDLTDNMDLRRMQVIDENNINRIKKYFNAYKWLISNM